MLSAADGGGCPGRIRCGTTCYVAPARRWLMTTTTTTMTLCPRAARVPEHLHGAAGNTVVWQGRETLTAGHGAADVQCGLGSHWHPQAFTGPQAQGMIFCMVCLAASKSLSRRDAPCAKIPRKKETDRQTDRQEDRQTDRQTPQVGEDRSLACPLCHTLRPGVEGRHE